MYSNYDFLKCQNQKFFDCKMLTILSVKKPSAQFDLFRNDPTKYYVTF